MYMCDYVTHPDNTREDIITNYYPNPVFSGGTVKLLQRGVGLLAIKSKDERQNLACAVFAKWLAQKDKNIYFAVHAGYLPSNGEALTEVLAHPDMVHNAKYQKLYTCMQQVYSKGDFLHLPHYPNAGETQRSLEYGSKNILRQAHRQYLAEVQAGAEPQAVLDRLVEESYQKLLTYK